MKTDFDEVLNDKLMNIDTTGRDDRTADDNHSPYEPTSYKVLDRLIDEAYITENDYMVDFGCGKGRVPIYLSSKTGCRAAGVEMEDRFIEQAQRNLFNSSVKDKVLFVQGKAEEFTIQNDMNRFYFFNPFSFEIFKSILSNIMQSQYEAARDIYLFFYYPSDEYVAGLMTEDNLEFYDEIDCNDIFGTKNMRERILIFTVA